MRNDTTTARFWARVEKTDTCWNWTGKTTNGYGRVEVNGSSIQAHRRAWQLTRGPIPDGMVLDHLCHNKACVNPGHIRLVTMAENIQNRKGAQADSKSGHRGVSWRANRGKWEAQVMKNRKRVYRAWFDELDEAIAAAKAARAEHFGIKDFQGTA